MLNNYKQAVEWLFCQFPSYQEIGSAAYKPGLERVNTLLKYFNNPHQKTKTIHVAGTNGKGSTCSFLASLLKENGGKIGLFTSPHIFDFRERIRINGKEISEEEVLSVCNEIKTANLPIQPSFFEITFVMAMLHFAANKCDLAVIETGLGGRLDATNVLEPLLSVITNISFDHQYLLGNSLEEIATEKAGIIKQKIPVLVAEQRIELQRLFAEKAALEKSKIYYLNRSRITPFAIASYQQTNFQTALQALEIIEIEFTEELINKAIKNLFRNSGLYGRFQKIKDNPTIIIDAAHNIGGIQTLSSELKQTSPNKIKFLIGLTSDKNIEELIGALPVQSELHLCVFKNKRSTSYQSFMEFAKTTKRICKVHKAVNPAIRQIIKQSDTDDTIIICGSFFLISDINLKPLV